MELHRTPLEVLLMLSFALVWLGVFLEKDTFSKKTQTQGWRLLVAALAAETVLTGFLLLVDGRITRELISAVEPRVLTHTRLEVLGAHWRQFSGRQVSLSVAAYDEEARSLAGQIVEALKTSGVKVRDHIDDGAFELEDLRHVGIMVRGREPGLVSSITAELRGAGFLVTEVDHAGSQGSPKMDADADARIFVGQRPVPSLMDLRQRL